MKKPPTFLSSLGALLVVYAGAFGLPYVTSGTYQPRWLAAGLVIVVLLSIARVRLHQDLRTNDPDIRPHYKAVM